MEFCNFRQSVVTVCLSVNRKEKRISPLEASWTETPGPDYKTVDHEKTGKKSTSFKFGSEKTERTTLKKSAEGEMYDAMPGFKKLVEKPKQGTFSKGAKKTYVEQQAKLKLKVPGIGTY